jgi:uncharacterized protein with NAD-binding domain and iron-sulfur cluster
MDNQKKKIIVLGGGMSALAAAHKLTDSADWQDKYDITVYQTGWRLGGKTSTGRGKNDRIEEHGIHILQGWYDTTFRLLRSVYDERKNKNLAPDSPLQDLFADGLQANNTTLLTEYVTELGKWTNWTLIFPETDELPGDGEPLTNWQLMQKGVGTMLEIALGSPYSDTTSRFSKWILYHYFPKYDRRGNPTDPQGCLSFLLKPFLGIGGLFEKFISKEEQHLLNALRLSKQDVTENHHAHYSKILDLFEKNVKKTEHRGLDYLEKNIDKRHLATILGFAFYNLKGILNDVYNPTTDSFDFHTINNLDYRAWLSQQGAPDWLLHSVIVRFFYTGTFANLVNDEGGAIGAGTALLFAMNSLGYKGSFVFQFVYGTGDVMVMPMYEVLKNRGVKFKFFHTIDKVHYSASGAIETISYGEQVALTVPEYDPVYKVGTLNTWPSEPNYSQINPEEVAKLKAKNINLEDPWADWTDFRKGQLKKGEDFDEIILGIPIGTLKTICSEIIEKVEPWRLMTNNVQTTPTQSAQLWFLPNLADLGFNLSDWGLPPQNGAPNVVVYQNPMYSWLDSSLVLPNENWTKSQKPQFLAYYTGPFPLRKPLPPFSDHDYQSKETARLMNAFEQWLNDNSAWFFPKGANLPYPKGLNFQLLADPEDHTEGYDRFANQYFRANVRPTDHYTLSVPNTEQYRLKTDASGFDNLFLCGDWIDFGINVGYIDGAIQSGQQAAQAVFSKMDNG